MNIHKKIHIEQGLGDSHVMGYSYKQKLRDVRLLLIQFPSLPFSLLHTLLLRPLHH